jgi:hypothetical protein
LSLSTTVTTLIVSFTGEDPIGRHAGADGLETRPAAAGARPPRSPRAAPRARPCVTRAADPPGAAARAALRASCERRRGVRPGSCSWRPISATSMSRWMTFTSGGNGAAERRGARETPPRGRSSARRARPSRGHASDQIEVRVVVERGQAGLLGGGPRRVSTRGWLLSSGDLNPRRHALPGGGLVCSIHYRVTHQGRSR